MKIEGRRNVTPDRQGEGDMPAHPLDPLHPTDPPGRLAPVLAPLPLGVILLVVSLVEMPSTGRRLAPGSAHENRSE